MLTIGIDCGLTGAIAIIDDRSEVITLEDLPVVTVGRMKWIDGIVLARFIREARTAHGGSPRPAFAYLEATHAMPKLGVIAANSKGLTMGSTLVGLQVAAVSIELIAPQAWKRALGLLMPGQTDKEKKAASLSRARLLFPHADLERVKDHNRAEALLIAHYAQRHLGGMRAAA